jgi:hypothetical protein
MAVNLKEMHATEARPPLPQRGGSSQPEQRIFSSADQIPTAAGSTWLEMANGRVQLQHCSDLLEDFLDAISRMENEYLRAALEGHGTASAIAAQPRTRALDGAL